MHFNGRGSNIRLPPKWIELNLTKRECSVFIPSKEDPSICQCGKRKPDHGQEGLYLIPTPKVAGDEDWVPSKHTVSKPTDAYGQVLFEGEHYPHKARYVRLSHDTSPELVLQTMTLVWGLELPKLLITIRGGEENFELPPRLGKILQHGLLKAAKSTNAWVFTNGLNIGVTKHIGTALTNDQRTSTFRRNRIITIGIAPWGLVDHRQELIGHNRERTYCPIERQGSKYSKLNSRISNFLLVDNGTTGKAGAEIYFRRQLEKVVGNLPMYPHRACKTPEVCIVIEGGVFTLKLIVEYLYEDPPVPVVVFGLTGRASDLLAFILKRAGNIEEFEAIKENVSKHLLKMFKISEQQCELVLSQLRKIVAKRSLVTVYIPHQGDDDGFDKVLFSAIFKSQHCTPLQQLCLTLAWDRVDLAKSEVFVYGRDWSRETLEQAMMEALVSDRLNFVNLLLEHGLNMQTFLTPAKLEGLYGLDQSRSSAQMKKLLLQLARRHTPHYSQSDNLTLHEVGVAISYMMGHIYKSKYLHLRGLKRRTIDGQADGLLKLGSKYDPSLSSLGRRNSPCFSQPFDDLFIWAVLTKRHSMALLLWSHGRGALAKALVAVKLNMFFATQVCHYEHGNSSAEFRRHAEEWETISFELLDNCFKQDPKLARQILTMELDHWSKQTCLTLAVMANHRMLLGHPCCQILLADLWMGALNLKNHETVQILFAIVFPPWLWLLDFKSSEELKLLPHQEKDEVSSYKTEALKSGDAEVNGSVEVMTMTGTESLWSLVSLYIKTEKLMNGRSKAKSEQVTVELQEDDQETKEPEIQDTEDHDSDFNSAGPGGERQFVGQSGRATKKRPKHKSRSRSRSADRGRRSSFIRTRHQLSCLRKFHEFQKAPVTNFYRHTIAYIVFLATFAYVVLSPQSPDYVHWTEIYVIAYVGTTGIDCIREFLAIDAYSWAQKWREFRRHLFTITDVAAAAIFMAAVGLRFSGSFFEHGLLAYKVSLIYWNLRLYKYMSVHRFVGPKLVMMSRMLGHMVYFAMIIVVVLLSFGLSRESIRFPNEVPTLRVIANSLIEPYVMMFGEVSSESVLPSCGGVDMHQCPVGYWIIPVIWVVYMIVANVLIFNVLIAVFNGIYSEIDGISLEIWMFQRFNFVMEFEQKPLLPPPFIVISHLYQILRYLAEKCLLCLCDRELTSAARGRHFDEGPNSGYGNDHSLKTFPTQAEASTIFDFEEDVLSILCMTNSTLVKLADLEKMNASAWTSAMNYERQGFKYKLIQMIRSGLSDLNSKVEDNKYKLDKVLEFMESTNEALLDEHEIRRLSLQTLRSSHKIPPGGHSGSASRSPVRSKPTEDVQTQTGGTGAKECKMSCI